MDYDPPYSPPCSFWDSVYSPQCDLNGCFSAQYGPSEASEANTDMDGIAVGIASEPIPLYHCLGDSQNDHCA